MSHKNFLIFDGLSVCYDQQVILKNISLTIQKGEYVAVIGPNGSGKSTLLKSINRIVAHSSGGLQIDGLPVEQYAQKKLAQKVAYVSQNRPSQVPFFVYEMLQMGRYPYQKIFQGLRADDHAIIDEVIHLTEITDLQKRPFDQLSGGEKQKVLIAASIIQQPEILLLDEPTTHLDPKHHRDILTIISHVCQRYQMTILHVTHDLNYVMHWSKKILALKDGEVVFYGNTHEGLSCEHLHNIFEISFHRMHDPVNQKDIIIPEVVL
ncbi:MAG: ABC transporter ATP-binding protein [Candidatus Omnitrophica bacterium]|nr:ABC transporter ATP-binding protein [Candidatus Omnitrophota bacterium]